MTEKITKYFDWFLIGEKSTSYKNPLIVEKLGEYNGAITVYCQQIDGKQLVFDKESFMGAIKTIKGKINEKETEK